MHSSELSARRPFLTLLLLVVVAPISFCSAALECNEDITCAEAAPCCSEYGVCGTTPLHCGGGCFSAFSPPESCYADRIGTKCVSGFYDFTEESTWIMNADAWNGDPYLADFLVDPQFVPNLERQSGGGAALYLSEPSVAGQPGDGCRLSSTSYMQYGIFTARLKSGSAAGGMVTSFISLSDVRDEIDWEWVGGKPTQALTAYFHRGNQTRDDSRGEDFELGQPASEVSHEYSVDWNKDRIIWSIDGAAKRTVTRAELNGMYPDTPSRIQLGVWDAGASSSIWTQIWAGGPIDWSQSKSSKGYPAVLESISIQCAGDSTIPDAPPTRKKGYTAPTLSEQPIVKALDDGSSDYFKPGTPLSERYASHAFRMSAFSGVTILSLLAAVSSL